MTNPKKNNAKDAKNSDHTQDSQNPSGMEEMNSKLDQILNDLNKIRNEELKTIKEEISTIKKEDLKSIKDSLEFHAGVVDDLKNEIETIKNKHRSDIDSLNERWSNDIGLVRAQCSKMLISSQSERDQKDQTNLQNSLRIHGVPEGDHETKDSLKKSVLEIFNQALETENLTETAIIDVRRLKMTQENHTKKQIPPVVCQMTNTKTADEILKVKKKLKENQATKNISINQSLTPLRAKLLKYCNEEERVKFTVIKECKIVCRMNDNPTDLTKKKWVSVETPGDLLKLGIHTIEWDKLGPQDRPNNM